MFNRLPTSHCDLIFQVGITRLNSRQSHRGRHQILKRKNFKNRTWIERSDSHFFFRFFFSIQNHPASDILQFGIVEQDSKSKWFESVFTKMIWVRDSKFRKNSNNPFSCWGLGFVIRILKLTGIRDKKSNLFFFGILPNYQSSVLEKICLRYN